MNTNIIRKAIATIAFSAAVVGCGTVGNRSTAISHGRHDAPRGQIGRSYVINRSDAPRGQIGRAYAANTIHIREHILSDEKRCA